MLAGIGASHSFRIVQQFLVFIFSLAILLQSTSSFYSFLFKSPCSKSKHWPHTSQSNLIKPYDLEKKERKKNDQCTITSNEEL